jgi:hypothetical protein
LHGSGCIAGFGLLAEGHERQQEAERKDGKVGFHGVCFVMVWWMGRSWETKGTNPETNYSRMTNFRFEIVSGRICFLICSFCFLLF